MTTPKPVRKKPTAKKPPARPKPVEVVETAEGKTVQIQFGFTATDAKKVVWTGIQSFVGAFTVGSGAASLHSLSELKVAGLSAAIAGVSAGISAAKNLVLSDDSKIK